MDPNALTTSTLRSETTRQAFSRWLRQEDRTKGTVQSYWKQFLPFVDWWEAHGRPAWTPSVFDRYRSFLESDEAGQHGALSIKTIKLRVLAVRAFAAFLTSQSHWKVNPAQYLSARTPMDPLRSDPLEAPAIKHLVAQFETSEGGLRDRAIALLLATMGVRIVECCRLNCGDYIFDRYLDGKKHWLLRVPSRSYRWRRKRLVVTDPVKASLDRYLACRPPGEPEEPLFIVSDGRFRGQRVDPGGVGIRLSKAFRATGIAHASSAGHSLRLSAVQFAIENGATEAEVQKMLRVRHRESARKHFDKAGSKQPVILGAERLVTQLSDLS